MTLAPVMLSMIASAPFGVRKMATEFAERLSKAGVDSAAQLQARLSDGPAGLVPAVFPEETLEATSRGEGFPRTPEVCQSSSFSSRSS